MQNETLGHRGRSGDPLSEIRRLLLRGIERHTERSRARLDAGLADGDPRDELLDTLLAKETLRSTYAAGTSAEAARLLDAFLAECRDSAVPELHRLAKTVSRWRKEILAHHSTGASNGPTEAVESRREAGNPCRLWLPQLQELPATGPSSLRRRMARCSRCAIRGRSLRLVA